MRRRFIGMLVCAVLIAVPGLAQDRFSDASPSGIDSGNKPHSQEAPLPDGPLTFYGDRASFDAANPGLPCEDWEEFTDNIVGCDAPANSGTSCPGGYNAGDIEPGLEIDALVNTGPGGNGLVIIPTGFDGNPSIVFGSNTFTDSTVVNLSPAAAAIGFDVSCHFGSP